MFEALPAGGLQRLLHLKAHNNPNLRHFHPPALFPRIQVYLPSVDLTQGTLLSCVDVRAS